jgi:glycosyltransferase involved in cell wall biosynthesis
MRIAFVAPFGLGQKTTVWARTLPLARHLVTCGCEVTLLIPPWDTPADAGRSWLDQGVQVINVPLRGGLPRIMAQLLAHIHRLEPQIVHVVKPRAYAGIVQWIVWQVGRVRGKGPLLLLDVDDWEQAWSPLGGYSPLVARFMDWQEQWGIRHAGGVSAASRWLEAKVHEAAPQMPVLYLPNGIAPPASPPVRMLAVQDAPTVLLFSRFVEVESEWMGAFGQALQEELPSARLLVAGQALQPAREEAFRRALTRSGASVEWLGFMPPDQLSDLYARTDCAIFPAADVPLNQAKCSVRLANTLLRGVPVVASAVGEQANYGAHGAARLVPAAATPHQFAAAVADLLRQPETQQQLSEQARQRLLQDYNWPRLGEQLFGFYERLLREKT